MAEGSNAAANRAEAPVAACIETESYAPIWANSQSARPSSDESKKHVVNAHKQDQKSEGRGRVAVVAAVRCREPTT